MSDLDRLKVEASREGIDRLVVGVIVPHDGRILLLQRKADDFMPNIYEFPGGVVEPGESLPGAVARELVEETGLRAEGITGYLGHFEYLSGSGRRTRQLNFVVRVAAPGEIVHPEHQAAAWVDPDDLGGYPISDESRRVIRTYFETAR